MPAPFPLLHTLVLSLLGAPTTATPDRFPPGRLEVDIAPYHGLTIGGIFAAWGTATHLQPARAFAIERGKCGFRVGYEMVNQGRDATSAFGNTLAAGAAIIDTKNNLHLAAGQNTSLGAQVWLAPGTVDLIVHLDAGNVVPETNEQNNVARVRVTLDGQCGSTESSIPAPTTEHKASASHLPPGSINSADQTDEKPAPAAPAPGDPLAVRGAAEFGHPAPDSRSYGVPDTKGSAGGIIINDCQAALAQRLGTSARGILATCDGSVMTLTGQVPTAGDKASAERAARSVPGVTKVNNLLVVGQGNL